MTATPRVSILIPCHNAAPWVALTLESALAQTWPNTEVIVVDDGSRDDSLAIVQRYADRGVRVISQPSRGAAAARNAARAAASGDFLQYLDADDLLSPEKIAAQVECLRAAAGTDMLATCRWGRFTEDPAQSQFVDVDVFRDFTPADFLVAHTRDGRMMHPAAWLVPRHVAEKAGPWDESLSLNDDGEYFARVVRHAQGIRFTGSGATHYRSRLPGSLSGRRDRRAQDSLFRSVEKVAAHLLAVEESARTRAALADYWQRTAYELYPDAADLSQRAGAEAQRLGGSALPPPLPPRQHRLARIVGWKLTKRLTRLLQK